ncbi:hypothetical protein ACO1O0_005780 [Amphichorda felina]
MKWRGYCDGYSGGNDASTTQEAPSSSRLIHTKKAPLVVEEPLVNTLRFENSDQRAYFDEWSFLSVTFLGGGLNQTRLWAATMPQLTLEEPTLRYGAMAVGALRRAQMEAAHDPGISLTTSNRHYLNAIIYYCEALRLQSMARPTREGLRTAMLSSLLFICFETQRANMPAALKHITHGFSMLNELAACTEKAPDLVSIAPAPPALVHDILDCYRPLELQTRSFMGSYRKTFFPPGHNQPGNSPGTPVAAMEAHDATSPTVPGAGNMGAPPDQTSKPRYDSISRPSPPAQSPQSQPGTPWQSRSPTLSQNQQPPYPQTGLPSPQSQHSPQSQGDHQTPLQPQRAAGIMPFTKHTPYFRPKLSSITSLEDLPRVFSSIDEAQGYWGLLQKQMVQYIPVLNATTRQLNLAKVAHDFELNQKLDSVKQNPGIAKFIAESRYWLQRWIEAFDPTFQSAMENKKKDLQSYLQAANLRVEYLILYIYTAIPRFSGLATAQGLTPQYREMNSLAEMLLQMRPNCGFAMDSGWTWPLFVSAFACRDPAVREDAIRILGQYPIRNALRDSRVFRAIALRNQQAEADIAAGAGDEQSEWLRLRQRELVFEDFGTSVIFRSPQRDPWSGEWVLTEEAADFVVRPDGTLNWQRQPISESTSILSGVC